MTPETRERLAALLVVPDGAARSPWDQVKAEPLRPSPQRMREFLFHLRWLRGQEVVGVFAGVPDHKVRQFAAEAKTLNAADLGRLVEALLLPDTEAIVARCEAHAAPAGNNHLPLLTPSIRGKGRHFCVSLRTWRQCQRPRAAPSRGRSRSCSPTARTAAQSSGSCGRKPETRASA